MLNNGSLKILLLILFLPKILVAESQMKIACMSSGMNIVTWGL